MKKSIGNTQAVPQLHKSPDTITGTASHLELFKYC